MKDDVFDYCSYVDINTIFFSGTNQGNPTAKTKPYDGHQLMLTQSDFCPVKKHNMYIIIEDVIYLHCILYTMHFDLLFILIYRFNKAVLSLKVFH